MRRLLVTFFGAGYGMLDQLRVVDQYGIPFFYFKRYQDTARLGHTLDQFFKASYYLFANVRVQGSKGSLKNGLFRYNV